jgi:hypothetical protein
VRSSFASPAALALAVLALVGCGGSSEDTTASANSPYGEAAGAEERAAITAAAEDFLAAEAAARWDRACDLMSAEVRRQLEQMKKGKDCAAGLAALFKQNPAQLQAAREIEVDDARLSGSNGYVFYSTAKTDSAYLPLKLEGGSWKVATISGSTAPAP